MPRYSDTVYAEASAQQSWDTLQDAGVWGSLLGAAEISDIRLEDGELKSCSWTAKIGGSNLDGTMTVEGSTPLEYMDVMIRAAEWRCRIEMMLEAEEPRKTRIHSKVDLTADGFTALLALPVVSGVIGRHFPQRMLDLAELMGT